MRLKEAANSHASLIIHSPFQLSINRGRRRAVCAEHSLSLPPLTVADAADVTDFYQSLLAAQTHSATATKKKGWIYSASTFSFRTDLNLSRSRFGTDPTLPPHAGSEAAR